MSSLLKGARMAQSTRNPLRTWLIACMRQMTAQRERVRRMVSQLSPQWALTTTRMFLNL